jgi:hypothetical protein
MEPDATCRCDKTPDRPCSAAITQEDLLCDQCRASREESTVHVVLSWLTPYGPVPQHHAVPVNSLTGFFSPEGS